MKTGLKPPGQSGIKAPTSGLVPPKTGLKTPVKTPLKEAVKEVTPVTPVHQEVKQTKSTSTPAKQGILINIKFHIYLY